MAERTAEASLREPLHVSGALPSARVESRLTIAISTALLCIGVALRVLWFVDRRSLWLDEAWIALNIVTRSYRGLVGRLDFEQSAPIGFLWSERLAVVLGGANELALRALPLLAGCALLMALWLLVRRLLDARSAALCLAIAALSPALIYYSNEVKPYSTDALLAVVLVWLTLDVLEEPDRAWAWRRLIVGGAVAILFSTPSVFVLTGVGAALVAQPAIRGSRSGRLRMLVAAGIWATVFVILYFAIYRDTANDEFMLRSLANEFLYLPPRRLLVGAAGAARIFWLDSLFSSSETLVPPKALTAVTILTFVGVLSLARRRGLSAALVVVVPFLAVAAAALAHRWPLTLRHLLFLVPFLVLLLAAGTTAVADLFSPRARGFVLGVIGVLLLVPVVAADVNDVRHPRRGDVTPLIREYSRSKSNGALIYVMAYEVPTWLFYTLRWDQRESASFKYAMSRANLTEHLPTRGCVRQSPGTRVVFGTLIDSGTAPRWSAAEAQWIQAQPEREVWLLGDSFEFKNAGRMLDEQLIAQGARRTLARTYRGTELRRYQSLRPSTTATAPSCEGSH